MKKTFIIFFILFLILFTAIIKNSTKKIEEDIFTSEENLRRLNKEFENIKFLNLYFDDELIEKDIKDINIIDNTNNKFQIKKLKMHQIQNNEK